jgi:hypothetical protein
MSWIRKRRKMWQDDDMTQHAQSSYRHRYYWTKLTTSLANIVSGTGTINLIAKSFGTLSGTSQVGIAVEIYHTLKVGYKWEGCSRFNFENVYDCRNEKFVPLPSIVRNISRTLNEFIGTGMVSTMTRSSHIGSTIQNELNGKIDVVSLSLASNFDAISKTAQSPVGPTTSTVLWNVLETIRQSLIQSNKLRRN